MKSLDLSNFYTPSLKDTYNMFGKCSSLKYLDLSTFDTSDVTYMYEMFTDCTNLKYLDLSSFSGARVNNIQSMFYKCKSLIFLSLKTFTISSSATVYSIFGQMATSTIFCAEDTKIKSQLTSLNLNCDHDCFNENIKIDETQENKCVESCNYFEYNKFCIDECPEGTLVNDNICEDNKCLKNNHNSIECLDNTPEGYYFDKEDGLYKKCYQGCKFCYGQGDATNNNCIGENPSSNNSNELDQSPSTTHYELLTDTENKHFNFATDYLTTVYNDNSYEKNSQERFQDTTNIIGTFEDKYSTSVRDITEKTNNIISSELNIFSHYLSDNNKTEINEQNYPIYNLLEQLLFHNFNKTINYNNMNLTQENQDEILKTIQNIIQNGFDLEIFDKLNIPSLTVGNFTYTITSTLIQEINKNNNNNITVDLGECEYELKDKYNISKNDSLYLLIVNGKVANIPKVEYEVFYPFSSNNFSVLNLNYCKDMAIDISYPIDIPINEIDKYNKSSGLYNDICYTLTTENETDINLKDRRNEFVDKNYSICEEDCDFTEYDYITKRAKCSCMAKIKLPLISEIKVDKYKLLSNFKDIRNIGNFKMLKCTYLLFNKDNIFKNSANYIIALLLFISILTIFIFAFYNVVKIKEFIRNKIKSSNLKFITDNSNKIKIDNNKKIKETNGGNVLSKEHPKQKIKGKSKSLFNINFNQINYNNNYHQIKKKKIIKKVKKRHKNTDKLKNNINKKDESGINLKNKNFDYSKQNLKENENESQLVDEEINSLDYEEAKKKDKRTYCQYYASLIRTNHSLIFTFCNYADGNSQEIYIFFYTFVINYAVSAMFYSDDTMHKIYEDKGLFDFTYQVPQMIYSFIISSVLEFALGFFGLYEDNIIDIKNEKDEKKSNKIFCIIKFKIIIFFVITYILLFFIWVYLGCFCAVYKNTQMHLLKDVSSSFAISFINPFFSCLLPGMLRIPSLRSKSNLNIMYKFSKFLQIF